MIRNDAEYREAKARAADFADQARRVRQELTSRGLSADAIDVAVSPQSVLASEIAWDVNLFEQLRAGKVEAIPVFSLEERGKALVCLRIVKGWTQRQLAEALQVTEAQVSRDERHEYRGISLERYARIVDALGFCGEEQFVPKRHAVVIQFPNTRIMRIAASFTPSQLVAGARPIKKG